MEELKKTNENTEATEKKKYEAPKVDTPTVAEEALIEIQRQYDKVNSAVISAQREIASLRSRNIANMALSSLLLAVVAVLVILLNGRIDDVQTLIQNIPQ